MVVLGAGVAAALLVGWWQPAPWLLALSLSVILSAVWSFAIFRWLKSGYGTDSALPN